MTTTTGVAPAPFPLGDLPTELLPMVLGFTAHFAPSTQVQVSAVSQFFYNFMSNYQCNAGISRAMLRISPQAEVTEIFSDPELNHDYTLVAETNMMMVFHDHAANNPTLICVHKTSETIHRVTLDKPNYHPEYTIAIGENRFIIATRAGVLTCFEASLSGVTPILETNLFENVDLNGMEALQNPVLDTIYMFNNKLHITGRHDVETNWSNQSHFGAIFDRDQGTLILQRRPESRPYKAPFVKPSYSRHFPHTSLGGHLNPSRNGLTLKPEGRELQIWRNNTQNYLNSVELPCELLQNWSYGILQVRIGNNSLNLMVQSKKEGRTSIEVISFTLGALDDETAAAQPDKISQVRAERFPEITFQETVQNHLDSTASSSFSSLVNRIKRGV